MKGLLDYLQGDSILHKMHPISKLLLSFFICLAAFISDKFYFLIGLIVLNLLIALIGEGKSKCGVFKRSLGILKGLLKISIFLFIIQLLCIRDGNVVFKITENFGITDTGINTALILVLRLTGATLPLAIVISVTNLNDLANTLVKSLHIPYKYAYTVITSIRFIPIFASEMSLIIDSQKARGVDFEIKNPFKKLSLILPLCFPLLLSSVRKIESTTTATELRGFYFRKPDSCYRDYKVGFADFVFTFFAVSVLVFSFLY
ncbi:MAG: energy-coupling factor transporter transmembrane protein EcfT [Treponema sp.]|uniref:energy-coupling factor transporter transmembrane component T family protein n=1 Tax=Treponema sp. TaxID=166 RepID=UPI00298EC9DF|nr:energy-coupling factor transporter transmembrane component T [Treponema sp.]MBR5933437.1 energy-coupling factor transporter transmembrane protein EcfT [Treponema sp.]